MTYNDRNHYRHYRKVQRYQDKTPFDVTCLLAVLAAIILISAALLIMGR